MKCPSRVPVISKQFRRTPSPKVTWGGRSWLTLSNKGRKSGPPKPLLWQCIFKMLRSLLQPDCAFTNCLPWLSLWGHASTLLHWPFNPGASISNKDANYPISYLNFSQYQALAAFQDSPMPSKPVLLGWLLNNITSLCQCKAQLWLPVEYGFYLPD